MGSSNSSGVLLFESSSYFSEAVEAAWQERSLPPSPHLKSYITELLLHFLKSENLWSETVDGRKTREMLAVSLLKAQDLPPKGKIKTLKSLGDHSLYMSGLFPDFFQRKIIDVDYYVDIGKSAFSTLSDCVGEESFSSLYNKIAMTFEQLVDVLGVISQKSALTNTENILRMYDLYDKTSSARLEELLAEKGIVANMGAMGLKKKQ